jgi:hypothetical protein
MQGTFYTDMFSVTSFGTYTSPGGDTGWQWKDGIVNIGDPRYPRLIWSSESKTGLITGTRLTSIVNALVARNAMTVQPTVGQLLNNIVSEHNQQGSVPDNASRITLWGSDPSGAVTDDYIKFWNYNLDHAVRCDYFDGTILTSVDLLNENDDWIYGLATFNPAEVFNLTKNFYFVGTDGTVPWDDSRIQNYVNITVQQLLDQAVAHGWTFS